ncbi:TOBE domain-containing protein [Ampullimonas aquatilis]|uniref:TOBE domain-containing protein n=1 Tax=Ampullimonas aquatilis TaxID=1341549 RepID=UPI003C79261C
MEPTSLRLLGKLEVDTEFGAFLGNTRIKLLEAVESYGSISQAAKAVPLSYRAAWDAIDDMNNLAEHPLVIRSTGGKKGGGTQLTDYGRKVIALYRALEAEYQAALDRMTASMNDDQTGDFKHFRQLLKRMSMKTSARNQFAGTVIGLREGDVDFEVRLRIGKKDELVAIITKESAETFNLQMGSEVNAIIKSSSVMLLTDPNLKTTARNHLWGEITRIFEGPVNSEITLVMPSGKTVCSVVTHDSVVRLGLTAGQQACAVFKASDVILCLYA